MQSIGWDAQGNLLVTAASSILQLCNDGKPATVLTGGSTERMFTSSVCPNGGPILLSTFGREGKKTLNMWRVNADGAHTKQLTAGKDDQLPLCSPDGKSFYDTDNVGLRTIKAHRRGNSGARRCFLARWPSGCLRSRRPPILPRNCPPDRAARCLGKRRKPDKFISTRPDILLSLQSLRTEDQSPTSLRKMG